MNEMIERAMDAVDRLQAFDFNNLEREQLVKTVLKAMREPTEVMKRAGEFAYIHGSADAYRAMIDEILEK